VHNALAASGFVEVGPIRRGTLAAGSTERIPIELAAGCTTMVLLATAGAPHDLDLELLGPEGASVAHDTSREPEAALHACVREPGTYTLLTRTDAARGEYVLATWWAATYSDASSTVPTNAGGAGTGTCDAPILIGAGDFSGSTLRGESDNEGSCANSGARELVYRLDLTSRKNVAIDVTTTRFDSVLYVRKAECADESAEVACNDDAPNQHHSRIDAVFDPGTYYVFVDGYGNDGGPFQLKVAYRDVPPLAQICGGAPLLASGTPETGATTGMFDEVHATCGDGAHGPDTPFALELPARSRVRIREESGDFAPVVHVRKVCADETSEVGCAAAEAGEHSAAFVGLLAPGRYTVFADATDHDADGRFNVLPQIAPELGSGTLGDGCGDAIPLRRGENVMTGDTFLAHDDTSGKCGGAGAADVLYRVEASKRSHFLASFSTEESPHIFILSKMCADQSTEIACGRSVDETLAAGTYFLAVDGQSPDAFGQFSFAWSLRDLASQEAGCAGAPLLPIGPVVTGTTAGQSNKFMLGCSRSSGSAGDRVYRLVVSSRARVRLTVTAPGFSAVLALRTSCLDVGHGAASTVGPDGSAARPVEVACNVASEDAHQALVEANLEPGTYFVVVDGKGSTEPAGKSVLPVDGPFTLQAQIAR
jgi:hypothetical protein